MSDRFPRMGRWTPEQERLAAELARAGKSYKEIGLAVNRSTNGAEVHVSRVLKLKKPPAARPSRAGDECKPMVTVQKRKDRRCLSCRRVFRSHGPGNRICDCCKSNEAYRCSQVII